jgi:hypothetical protein
MYLTDRIGKTKSCEGKSTVQSAAEHKREGAARKHSPRESTLKYSSSKLIEELGRVLSGFTRLALFTKHTADFAGDISNRAAATGDYIVQL